MNNNTGLFGAVAALALTAGSASAQVFSSSPSLPVPPGGTVSDTITIFDGPTRITDLNVVVRLLAPRDSDIDLVLQDGQSGSFVTLSTDNGGSGTDFLTTRFDDSASTSITAAGAAGLDGNFRPEATFNGWSGRQGVFVGPGLSSLSAFNGGFFNLFDEYTLWVANSGSGTGTLLYWSLEFNFAADPVDPNQPPPIPPLGAGAITDLQIEPGQTTGFRVTVTPPTNPPSTGLRVTVDGTAIGQGLITLLDDGINDDGIAGNNVFGRNVAVNVAPSDYALGFAISDAQNRSSSGSFPVLTVLPPAPTCPPGLQPQAFDGLLSFGLPGDESNSTRPIAFTGDDVIGQLHISGRLISRGIGNTPSQSELRLSYTDGSFDDVQLFGGNNSFDTVDLNNFTFFLNPPRPASEIAGVETFQLFDNAGVGARWETLCITSQVFATPQRDESIDGGGDAGELPATAQIIRGSGELRSLSGNIESVTDSDMYMINICDPAHFSASTFDTNHTLPSTRLWLFRSDGTGVEFSDDVNGSILDSTFVREPGLYYLAITGFVRDPLDSDGNFIWAPRFFAHLVAPDGPGATNPIAGWLGELFFGGTYIINFTGTCLVESACDPDLNQDGNADQADIDYLINVVAGGVNPTNIDPDFNADGNVDQADVDSLLNVVAGGACP